jgi:hypothetical protein
MNEGSNNSSELNDLMFLALDHGFASIEDKSGPLVPFVMVRTISCQKTMHRFVCERLEEGVKKAKAYIEANKSELEMYAIAWDGYVTLEGKRWDAILVEASERSNELGFLLCQRYETKGTFKKKNHAVGNPALIDRPVSLLFQS